ncbi:hydratase [Pararhizobium mangrovi]|uniref:hydratase n=1 Tax=Pararhizobium mangrovi TaxID=2590452 RepID=UPI0015E85118|nr:hydratase [Pararhizobium mangrovi]
MTIIGFVGSVFSPYYVWSGFRRPENHCAINVALYGRQGRRWTMTERGARHVERSAESLRVGPSRMDWDGEALTVSLDEMSAPIPKRVRGRVVLKPERLVGPGIALDPAGCHVWRPIAPRAQVSVELEAPHASWHGTAYWDSNAGSEPLSRGFDRWTWCRADLGERTVVFYDHEPKGGLPQSLAFLFDPSKAISEMIPQPSSSLRASPVWRMPRTVRCDEKAAPRVVKTLEDAPFYARSLIETEVLGTKAYAVHESLSLTRLDSPITRQMLPWRMPRRFF